jgi:aspartyl aminopeptidase
MISHGDIDFPLDLSRGLLGDMPAISADVGIALGNQELEMIGTNELDIQNCPKSGWGCFIDAEGFSGFGSRTTSPRHISNLVSLLEKNLIGRNKSSRFHITGNSITQDSDFSSGTMSDELAKFMPCVDMGIPVIGLHHPTCEVLNIYDLFWTKEAYKIYLQN